MEKNGVKFKQLLTSAKNETIMKERNKIYEQLYIYICIMHIQEIDEKRVNE